MNTNEIYDALKDVPHFVGVFSSNTIPYINQGSIVVNTQSDNLGGEHWICAIINDIILYYDPLNFPLSISLYNYFLSLNKNFYQVPFASQSISSQLCGEYCVFFIKNQYPAFK